MWLEPGPSPKCATLWGWVEDLHSGWPGVAGIGGLRKLCHPLGDSLHTLPVMPRRWGTHRSAWIAQEPRQNPEFAPFQSVVRNWGRGMGAEVSIVS